MESPKVSGQILAVVGFTPDETFSSVETRRVLGPAGWRNLEPLELKIGRANLITAEVSGSVYAAGGFDIESSAVVGSSSIPTNWAMTPLTPPGGRAGTGDVGDEHRGPLDRDVQGSAGGIRAAIA